MSDKTIRRLVAVMLLALLGLVTITPYQVLGQGEATQEVTPTEEVTPEVTPTEEITPDVTPTEEITPEVTPTEEVTPEETPTEITPTEPTPTEVTPTQPTPTEPTPTEITPTEPTPTEVTPTEPTPTEPTPTEVTPTQPTPTEPTASPTPLGCQKNNPERLDCSSLKVTAVCDGTDAVFTITNTGEPGAGDMVAPTEYRVIVDGDVIESGDVLLDGGESMTVIYSGGGSVKLEADQQVGHPGNSHPNAIIDCGEPEETPTASPTTETPTVEPTTETPTASPTPTETPDVGGEGQCDEDGTANLFIKNLGSIAYSISFAIFNSNTDELLAGTLDLSVGDNILVFSLNTSETQLRLSINLGWLEVFLDPCEQPTPTPTIEPTTETPTAEPTTETPTAEPTTETPTAEPTTETPTASPTTETPTASPTPLGCQKNNPERLDCSSLQVTVICMGTDAVFTITNTGKPGEGDMVAPTEYRLIKNDEVIESGDVLLDGGETMQITYSDGGFVTLEADQQVGHPGSSHPNATIKCSDPTAEPTTTTPTAEPTTTTPTAEPTTTTPEPTTTTPTAEPTTTTPTAEPTPLGCQKNNPERLDCSSLQVTAACQGTVAVFTIKNTGVAGDGDMRAATEYRLIKSNVVIQTGDVLLLGQATMQVTYSGGGTVKLEADQQVGHPGNSHPNASIKCSN